MYNYVIRILIKVDSILYIVCRIFYFLLIQKEVGGGTTLTELLV